MADVYYGSNVADASITTACDCAKNTTGGTEGSQTTTVSIFGTYAEITSRGVSVSTVGSVPATPTGQGWVYKFPQPGSIAAGNYAATMTLAWALLPQSALVRFFYLPAGSLSSAVLLASLAAVSMTSTAKTTYTWAAVAGALQAINSGDYLYMDAWYHNSNASGCNPTVYESTSSSAGVANDAQFTTPVFTPSGGGGGGLVPVVVSSDQFMQPGRLPGVTI